MCPCVSPDLRVLAANLNSLGHHKAVIEGTQLQELALNKSTGLEAQVMYMTLTQYLVVMDERISI